MRALTTELRAGLPARDAEALKAAVRDWASKIGVEPKHIQIQRMKRKWASCSSSGRICFSEDLLVEDVAFQEVVIVHELLHLRVPNHGKLFRSLMTTYVPVWEKTCGFRITRICGQRQEG